MPDEDRYEIDDLDRRIVAALSEDARKSYRELSRELDVALSTISNRVHRLEDEGVITGYVPVVDPEAVGLGMTAIVAVRISRGKLREVEESLAADDRVFGVYDVTGDWDCMALARFADRRDLDDFIKEVVSTEHVERTHTHVVLNTVKEAKTVPTGSSPG